jgi:hypothetical protein
MGIGFVAADTVYDICSSILGVLKQERSLRNKGEKYGSTYR